MSLSNCTISTLATTRERLLLEPSQPLIASLPYGCSKGTRILLNASRCATFELQQSSSTHTFSNSASSYNCLSLYIQHDSRIMVLIHHPEDTLKTLSQYETRVWWDVAVLVDDNDHSLKF
ncbi:hypothetical protein JHK82_046080 [Glycine max]|nr:hypothetical protein JHK82_046080 [Glycine max]